MDGHIEWVPEPSHTNESHMTSGNPHGLWPRRFVQQAERAALDFRCGRPVWVRGAADAWLAAPIEGMSSCLFDEMRAGTSGPVHLALTAHRLPYLGIMGLAKPASLVLQPRDALEDVVHWAADPTARWSADRALAPASNAGIAALALARHGLLIPAALCVKPDDAFVDTINARITSTEWLAVDADDVLAHCEMAPRLRRVAEADVPLDSAPSRFVVFREASAIREHVAVLIGDANTWATPLPVRVHSSCLTGDLFGSIRCDCGSQLRRSVAAISGRGGGILLYLQQEGRATGLANKMRAYQIQDDGLDTVDADAALGFDQDERDYAIAREMLCELGVSEIDLLTNNPAKLAGINRDPIHVIARSSLHGELTDQNRRYLQTKASRSGHWLEELIAPSARRSAQR